MKETTKSLEPEDWKFCAIIYLGVNCIDEVQLIHFSNHTIRIFEHGYKNYSGTHVAEVYTLKESYADYETAFHGSLDILTKVLARISIATFRTCKIIEPISVTQFKVEKKKPFTMLIPADYIMKPENKCFGLDEFSKLFYNRFQQELDDAISELSLAINSTTIYEKFLHYYNCIERVADLQTIERVKNKCNKCGEQIETPIKATANKMRDYYTENGFSNKEFNETRSVRAKLAHGATERTRDLNKKILNLLPIVEKIALKAVENTTNIKVLKGEFLIQTENQFIEIQGIKLFNKNRFVNAAYNIIAAKIHLKFRINEIGKNEEKEGFITDHIPSHLNKHNLKIFPFAWPY